MKIDKYLKRMLRGCWVGDPAFVVSCFTDNNRNPFAGYERIVLDAEMRLVLNRRRMGRLALRNMNAAYSQVRAGIASEWPEHSIAALSGRRVQPCRQVE